MFTFSDRGHNFSSTAEKKLKRGVIKYVIRNDDEHFNVESILLLVIVRNLKYVQVEFCYKLHM